MLASGQIHFYVKLKQSSHQANYKLKSIHSIFHLQNITSTPLQIRPIRLCFLVPTMKKSSSANLINPKMIACYGSFPQPQVQVNPTELSQLDKYDTNKLFEEFKRYIKRENHRQLKQKTANPAGEAQYKFLLSQVHKKKEEKLKKIQKLQSNLQTTLKMSKSKNSFFPFSQKNTNNVQQQLFEECKNDKVSLTKINTHNFDGCKFKPIAFEEKENKFRINSGKSRQSFTSGNSSQINNFMGSQFIKGKFPSYRSIEQISQSILMVGVEEKKLQEEITQMKNSLNQLKKSIETVKQDLALETRNQEKYKHISYLANSIENQTDYIRFQNLKGFHGMVGRQEQTLAKLKKFKTMLRKEKEEFEGSYIEDFNQFLDKRQESLLNRKKTLLFQYRNQKKPGQKQEGKKFRNEINITKHFITDLDRILEFLQIKQSNFEEIKQEQSTKVRLGKIKKELLPKEKIEVLERIEQFEDKFCVKISSISNLVLAIYRQVKKTNQQLEAQCISLNKLRQDVSQELFEIQEKSQRHYQKVSQNKQSFSGRENSHQELCCKLQKDSQMFVKAINSFYMLLLKFRHMYCLTLTLNIDKPQFRDCVIELDSLLNNGVFFNFHQEKHLLTGKQRHDVINHTEMQLLLKQNLPLEGFKQREETQQFHKQIVKLTEILFSDFRVSLMLHKSVVNEKIQAYFSKQFDILKLLELFQLLQRECQEAFADKLCGFSRLFLKCYKAISMSKYQMKLAAFSSERGSIFLPTTKVKKPCIEIQEDGEFSIEEQSQKCLLRQGTEKKITVTEKSQFRSPTGFYEKDPVGIIKNLQQLKNKGQKKFKQLNFSCQGKTYKYNQSITIPEFPLIDKD